MIDGVDVTTVPRDELRSRLTTVAQDQFFLPGTIRENVDPHGSSTAAEIEAALAKVLLWDAVQDKGGLDARLEEDALSQGQRQLFFLARAILRREHGRIVLLDEISSRLVSGDRVRDGVSVWWPLTSLTCSLDHDTEAVMQQVIEDEFREHTVIAIAHRLDTIKAFDRVLVLEKGCLVEHGDPRSLLEQHSSRFRALWNATHAAGE